MTPPLACPACGRRATLRPGPKAGRSWLAVVPCRACGVYAVHVISPEGRLRSWQFEGVPAAAVGETG